MADFPRNVLSHLSKFLIVSSKSDLKSLSALAMDMTFSGAYNYVTLYEHNERIFVKIDDILARNTAMLKKLDSIPKENITSELFSDRVLNSRFSVLTLEMFPFSFVKNGMLRSKYLPALKEISTKQNLSYSISFYFKSQVRYHRILQNDKNNLIYGQIL